MLRVCTLKVRAFAGLPDRRHRSEQLAANVLVDAKSAESAELVAIRAAALDAATCRGGE